MPSAIAASQIQPKPQTGYTVTLYSDIGEFENGEKVLFLPNIAYGTQLTKVKGYVKPYFPTYQFDKWTNVNGQTVSENTNITDNLVLVANYIEIEGDPVNFTTDSWATTINVCEKPGFIPFATAYCDYRGSDEADAMTSIRRWIISSENNIKNTYLKNTDSGLVSTKVRLIDISHDPIATNPGNYAKFTFEFTEVVGIMSFNNIPETPTGHMNEWYVPNEQSCLLREYLNSQTSFRAQLPSSLNSHLVQVNKVNEPNDSTGGTYISADYLFPLSRAEFNDVPTGDVEEEGQKPYLYYTQQQTTEHSQSPLRIKNYIGTDTPFNYWTRSTYLFDFERSDYDNLYAGGVVYDGGIHPSYAIFSGLGFAPAFCIGG